MTSCGLGDLVAASEEEFVEQAVKLARDHQRPRALSEIFEPLCGRKHSMFTAEARPPLYSERCANAIEAEYRKMWLQHLQETP